LPFTFYDSTGNLISPGAIAANVNVSAAVAQYFSSSSLGGNFSA